MNVPSERSTLPPSVPGDATAPCPSGARPVDAGARVEGLDVLRGVATLGILVMNLRNFAMPIGKFDDPTFPHGFSWPDFAAWATAGLLFRDKFIALFSMLFGAGVAVFADRAAAQGGAAGPYFRRHAWLFVIGVLHAYLVWYGDILMVYAAAGAALYAARRARPATLFVAGAVVFSVAIVMSEVEGAYRSTFGWLEASLPYERSRPPMSEKAAYTGSWSNLFVWRAWLNWIWHVEGALAFDLWRCAGQMLFGIALWRTGVLAGARPAHFYGVLAGAAYGVGLPLAALGLTDKIAAHRDLAARFGFDGRIPWTTTIHLLAGAAVALGHAATVLLIVRTGVLRRVRARLAAVGRMALTNYLAQSVLCALVFDGWAFGRWSQWGMAQQLAFGLAVWALQLGWSPLYLRRRAHGPVEAVWRRLTYGRLR
ncbi:MAG TPA: DUF418 domain-containing protein [Planctomycetota bacterium]|nr:DUF418 domain-containing protein [Planctomycetota bacterium]